MTTSTRHLVALLAIASAGAAFMGPDDSPFAESIQPDREPPPPVNPEMLAAYRADHLRRKAENFAKRQPKPKGPTLPTPQSRNP